MYATDDLRIASIKAVTPPGEICEEIPISASAAETTFLTRQAITGLLNRDDSRLLVVMGPCSIHDVDAAKEYAGRLRPLVEKYESELLIIMRVYFEKPRTTVGWKGLINDPDLDNSFHINKGIRLARGLLLDLNEMGIPAGTEFLDIITPQYVTDLVSWGAIGARTTESQVHRELASGLSCPVGFKNGTDGSVKIAVDAIRAASNPITFYPCARKGIQPFIPPPATMPVTSFYAEANNLILTAPVLIKQPPSCLPLDSLPVSWLTSVMQTARKNMKINCASALMYAVKSQTARTGYSA